MNPLLATLMTLVALHSLREKNEILNKNEHGCTVLSVFSMCMRYLALHLFRIHYPLAAMAMCYHLG